MDRTSRTMAVSGKSSISFISKGSSPTSMTNMKELSSMAVNSAKRKNSFIPQSLTLQIWVP